MKSSAIKRFLTVILVVPLFSIFITSCVKDNCSEKVTYIKKIPVYMTYEELRKSIEPESPQAISSPGKIFYTTDGYFFINEEYKGIHIIDNRDPHNPQSVGFINIPGNVDFAVNGKLLYADSYIDLVTIDISDPANAKEISRIKDFFQYKTQYSGLSEVDPEKGVVVGYNEEEVTEVVQGDCHSGGGGVVKKDWVDDTPLVANDAGNYNNNPIQGISGSMARFALSNGYLYCVDDWNMKVMDLSDPREPSLENDIQMGFGIETIWPYKDKLFVGSQTGVFIYDNSNPSNPYQLSQFQHARVCDPVVADDEYAYVTLRSGTPCQGLTNQLDVIDIRNISNPQLVKSYPMENPHGLDVDNKTLFICDGDAGLKVFDVHDPLKIDENQLANFKDINAYDVIAFDNILMLIGDDGFYQYEYSDNNDIHQISVIPVSKP